MCVGVWVGMHVCVGVWVCGCMVERGTYMYACAWCILYWAVFYLYKHGAEMEFGKKLGENCTFTA